MGSIDGYIFVIIRRISRNWDTLFLYLRPSNIRYAIIIGLGHPAMGTGFTTHLLRENNIDVDHERMGGDGIISWMAAVDDSPPNTNADRISSSQLASAKKFLIIRSPLKALNSVIKENSVRPSLQWRRSHILKKYGHDILPTVDYDHIDSLQHQQKIIQLKVAIDSLYYWYSICLEHSPEIVYRADMPEDDNKLSNFIGDHIIRYDDLYRNSKKLLTDIDQIDSYDIKLIGPEHTSKLLELLEKFEYYQDFNRVLDLAHS